MGKSFYFLKNGGILIRRYHRDTIPSDSDIVTLKYENIVKNGDTNGGDKGF